MQQQTVPYGGKIFRRKESYLIVPAMSLGSAEEMADTLDKCLDTTVPQAERRKLMPVAIHAALRLNYPDITLEQVRAFFTMHTIFPAFSAATGYDAATDADEVTEAPGEFQPDGGNGEKSPGGTSAGA